MARGSVVRRVLLAVVDRTGRGGTRKVRAAFEDVEVRFADLGHRLGRPVAAEILPIPIMGATTAKEDRHLLQVSARAVASNMLDGLLAHEMSHMVLTEAGHPSHDPTAVADIWADLPFPRAGRQVFGQAYNHVQDIYADDIAFRAGVQDRAYAFFSEWARGNAANLGTSWWPNVGQCVSTGFALGNLARHGLLSADDELRSVVRAFDEAAGLGAVDRFAAYYERLPVDPTTARFTSKVRELVRLLAKAADRRG